MGKGEKGVLATPNQLLRTTPLSRWHSDDDDDPMTSAPQLPDSDVPSHEDRLEACNIKLKDYNPEIPSQEPDWTTPAAAWLKAEGRNARSDARTLCHATMYEVKWDLLRLPGKVEARDAGHIQKSGSLAGGTSELDALLAYFDALQVGTESTQLKATKDDILRLVHILGESGDGDLDSLQKFSDEAYKLAFEKTDAGANWLYKQESSPSEEPKIATATDIADLDQMNLNQAALENVQREIADLRWKLFAIW